MTHTFMCWWQVIHPGTAASHHFSFFFYIYTFHSGLQLSSFVQIINQTAPYLKKTTHWTVWLQLYRKNPWFRLTPVLCSIFYMFVKGQKEKQVWGGLTWLRVGVINPGKVSVICKKQENGNSNSGVNWQLVGKKQHSLVFLTSTLI